MYFLSLMIFFFCFFFLTSISLATRIAELEPLPLRIAAAMSSACCTRVVVADGFPIKYLAEGGEGRRLFWIFLVSARASLAVYFLLLLLLRSLMLSNEKHSIFLVRLAASKDAAAILEAILKELVSMSMLLLLLLYCCLNCCCCCCYCFLNCCCCCCCCLWIRRSWKSCWRRWRWRWRCN